MMKAAHPAPDWSLFDHALQQDIAHSEQLLSVLLSERKALEAREYGDLENLIAQKKVCVELLEANAARRRQWLSHHGLNDDFTALDAVKHQASKVAARWEAAANAWRECQTANQINEQICRRTRFVVDRVLDLLRGQNASSATYDAKGYSQRTQGGHTISNA
jgi:flagellar biosynthesis protein FlgN